MLFEQIQKSSTYNEQSVSLPKHFHNIINFVTKKCCGQNAPLRYTLLLVILVRQRGANSDLQGAVCKEVFNNVGSLPLNPSLWRDIL